MEITHLARWQHAMRATKAFAGWKVRAIESIVVAGSTYYGLRHVYSQGEAMPHMLALAIATGVGLVVFPVFEFASHYLDAPRAIELAGLREENARLKQAVPVPGIPVTGPVPKVPGRLYVKEGKPSEVIARLKDLKWNERQVVAQASYIGFWARWRGEIADVQEHGAKGELGFTVSIWGEGQYGPRSGPFIHLSFAPHERHKVIPFAPGQQIEYEGKITVASTADITLENVSAIQLDT
jgi:hypothetical protein